MLQNLQILNDIWIIFNVKDAYKTTNDQLLNYCSCHGYYVYDNDSKKLVLIKGQYLQKESSSSFPVVSKQ